MSKWMLAAGAAALAIVSPSLAQQGEKGGAKKAQASQPAKGGGGGDRARAQRGGGGERAVRVQRGGGDRARAQRGSGGGDRIRAQRGGGDRVARVRGGGRDDDRRVTRANRGEERRVVRRGGDNDRRIVRADRGNERRQAFVDRRDDRRDIRIERGDDRREARFDRQDERRLDRGDVQGFARFDSDNDRRIGRFVRGGDRGNVRLARFDRDDDFRFVPRWNDREFRRGFDNCPPGLAKRGNGCLPPGQERRIVGTAFSSALAASVLGGPYRDWYRDDDDYFYRWDDDYIYRVRRDRGIIDAFFPYYDHDYYYYPVGIAYPSYYNYYNVPYQYRSYYIDDDDCHYRYADGAIYCVDPDTQLVQAIVALLTGAPLAVGHALPPSYSVYNVPLAYRARYYDTSDVWYRYNDGYIYEVDPRRRMITEVIVV